MKDGVILLILGVLLIGGVLLWQSHVIPLDLVLPTSTHTESPASEPAAPPSKPVISRRKAAPPRVADITPVAETTAAAPETIPAAVPRDPPPFPAVDEIATGAREDAVTAKFGDPALSTLTSSGGHTVRTYVYTRDRGRAATVIQLEDGVVASAKAKLSPRQASGLSVPRPKRAESRNLQ